MPTNKIYMLSTQYLKDNTVINNNVDDELLNPFIIQSQNVHIEQILGSDLFDEVCNEISGNTISANNKILLDEYIQPTLKEWVVFESLPFLNYKLTNKSVASKSSDNSDPADLSDIKYLRGTVRDIAEYMDQRMIDYLKRSCNEGKYPLYRSNNDMDDIKPTDSSYFGGIYLD